MGNSLGITKLSYTLAALVVTLSLLVAFNNCAPNGFQSSPLPTNSDSTSPIAPASPGDPLEPGAAQDYGDPGSGSWTPPGTSNRLIADQSGTSTMKLSYIPGCLNGAFASNGSRDCALNNSYGGFSFAPGNVLGLRYMSKETLSPTPATIKFNNEFGSSVSRSLRAWLSVDPTASYENTPKECQGIYAGGLLYIITGPGYCQIQPNTRYYLLITDDVGTGSRFIVDEYSADLD